MRIIKSALCYIVSFALIISLTACSSSPNDSNKDYINSSSTDSSVFNVTGESSSNTGSPTTTGASEDKEYNIYDMASNVMEWSTENCSYSGNRYVFRGGIHSSTSIYTSTRTFWPDIVGEFSGFRPILYIQ